MNTEKMNEAGGREGGREEGGRREGGGEGGKDIKKIRRTYVQTLYMHFMILHVFMHYHFGKVCTW